MLVCWQNDVPHFVLYLCVCICASGFQAILPSFAWQTQSNDRNTHQNHSLQCYITKNVRNGVFVIGNVLSLFRMMAFSLYHLQTLPKPWIEIEMIKVQAKKKRRDFHTLRRHKINGKSFQIHIGRPFFDFILHQFPCMCVCVRVYTCGKPRNQRPPMYLFCANVKVTRWERKKKIIASLFIPCQRYTTDDAQRSESIYSKHVTF